MLLCHFKFSFKEDKLNFRFIGSLTIYIIYSFLVIFLSGVPTGVMVGKVVLLLVFRLAGLSSNFCLTFLCAAAEKEKNLFTGLGLPSTLHKRGKNTDISTRNQTTSYIYKSKYKKVDVLPIRIDR